MISSLFDKTKTYDLNLVWSEGGGEHRLAFELPWDRYSPFLRRLTEASGKSWYNAETEWTTLKQQLALHERSAISMELKSVEGISEIPRYRLPRGHYQLVLVEHEAGRGQLYFFKGRKLDARKLTAALPVTVESLSVPAKEVELKFAPGSFTLTDIYALGKHISFEDTGD